MSEGNAQRLAAELIGTRFECVGWVAETDSTNTDLLGAAADPSEPEQVLVADLQRAGRGRRDRTWENSPGSALMMSLLIRPTLGLSEAHRYTTALGLAAREACSSEVGVHPRIKWPNDLVFGNAKLAGMLSESYIEDGDFRGLVLGIGINVWSDAGWSDEVRGRATSLTAEAVDTPEIDRVALAAATLRRFDHWSQASAQELREENLRHTATVGTLVSVQRTTDPAQPPLVGEAVDIDADGHLIVVADGVRHELSVGDVTHLRRG